MSAPALKLPSLHDLGDAQGILDSFLFEAEGEETPEIAELWDRLSGEIDQKIERWGLWLRGQKLQAELIKAEEERLRDRRKAIENAVERGKAALQMNMERLERLKVKGTLATVSVVKNPPSCRIDRILPPDELVILHQLDERLVVYTPPQPAQYALSPSGVIAASKKVDGKGKTIGYESPIEGVVVEQGASLRIS